MTNLTQSSFHRGASFMLQTDTNTWERVTIHPNCADELIYYVKCCFRTNPGLFKPVEQGRTSFKTISVNTHPLSRFDDARKSPIETAYRHIAKDAGGDLSFEDNRGMEVPATDFSNI